ncbi:MAG: PD-(D/E)XK nuclease family protein [Candidatus Sericytochromatia bacterium]|nr:PD-(D/E)XK nuclease family protein [Candidatus Sericytochromatia bacterium]
MSDAPRPPAEADALPRLSAHALEQLGRCPRKFALLYKARRFWPAAAPTAAEAPGLDARALGVALHTLVQRQALGLPLAASLAEAAEALPALPPLWEAFTASPHAQPDPEARTWTEQPLHLCLPTPAGPLPLEVRYDRLVLRDDGWTILDWKTGHVGARLAGTWQTRLYPFVLAEAGQALTGAPPPPPDRIRLTYWEVATGQGLTLRHDEAQHDATRAALEAVAARVALPFDEAAPDDPAYPREPAHCGQCPFDSLCNGQPLPAPARPPQARPRLTP